MYGIYVHAETGPDTGTELVDALKDTLVVMLTREVCCKKRQRNGWLRV